MSAFKRFQLLHIVGSFAGDVTKFLSWNENGREFEKGFTLWTSLLTARTSSIQIVIGVGFTVLFLASFGAPSFW